MTAAICWSNRLQTGAIVCQRENVTFPGITDKFLIFFLRKTCSVLSVGSRPFTMNGCSGLIVFMVIKDCRWPPEYRRWNHSMRIDVVYNCYNMLDRRIILLTITALWSIYSFEITPSIIHYLSSPDQETVDSSILAFFWQQLCSQCPLSQDGKPWNNCEVEQQYETVPSSTSHRENSSMMNHKDNGVQYRQKSKWKFRSASAWTYGQSVIWFLLQMAYEGLSAHWLTQLMGLHGFHHKSGNTSLKLRLLLRSNQKVVPDFVAYHLRQVQVLSKAGPRCVFGSGFIDVLIKQALLGETRIRVLFWDCKCFHDNTFL